MYRESGFKISFVAVTEQVSFMSVEDTSVPGTYKKLVNTSECMFEDLLILVSSGKWPRGGNAANVDLYPFIYSFVLSINTVAQSSSFGVI